MGMWPFSRRRSKRAPLSTDLHEGGPGRLINASDINVISGIERRRSRKGSRRRKSSKDSKHQQRHEKQRAFSFSPGRNDSIRVPQDHNQPPVPRIPSIIRRGERSATAGPPSAGMKRALRSNTEPPEEKQDWQRVPTLTKRKSSKKRKTEHIREEEIKAMLPSMPTRPATDAYMSGRPMKKDTKKMRDGLEPNFQNPSSDISLPLAQSIHSSLSGEDQHASYILTGLDMLAPRPTIRYSESPRYGNIRYGSDSLGSRKRKVAERLSLPEETIKANRRVDDLADDLDAGELRELMERDQKRREKKRIAENMKMERKLARRQEKQKQDEADASRNGTPPPENMERGVLGREIVGLGIGTSAVVTSNKRRASSRSSGRGKRPSESLRQDSTTSYNPRDNFHRSPSLEDENFTPDSDRSAFIETAKVGTVAKATVSPPGSPTISTHKRGSSSISQMMYISTVQPEAAQAPAATTATETLPIPIPARKPSPSPAPETSPISRSWTSFFKRSSKPKRASGPPSVPPSFSNTSRDSMQNGQGPIIGYTPMRSTSNIPKRTMSKFREDLPEREALPELPLSPPDSRVQSPEADVVPPIREYPEKKSVQLSDDPKVRYDTPTSGFRSLRREETPTSYRSIAAPSPEPIAAMSQSLASIDSEGSWLSGGKGGSKRSSSNLPHQPLRESASSLEKKYKEYSESNEELGIAEDEYFSRLTPGPEEEYKIHQRRSKTMPSSDEEDGGSIVSPTSEKSKWGAVARTPTVVHREPRAKSREGLLNDYSDADYDTDADLPFETAQEDFPTTVQSRRKSYGFNQELENEVSAASDVRRATSIDLGKGHARRISAGSAKILNLTKNSDGKRLSTGTDN